MTDEQPHMYTDLAPWFHLITSPESYAEEAAIYSRLLVDAARRPVRTVLELGSGGGNNASHMKRDFDMTLTDLSQAMLDLSRTINPELEHVQGDMCTVRLGRKFDAVFVHDAVSYLTTEEQLRAAIETAAVHCEQGGAALFCPDDLRENVSESVETGGYDGEDGQGLRYMAWSHGAVAPDHTTVTDFAYLLREADGSVRAIHDRHVTNAFPRELWLRYLDEAGFDATVVPLVHSEVEEGAQEMFVCFRRA